MGQIFKIAIGVIIGLLVFQILIFKQTDENYIEQSEQIRETQDLKNKLILLTNSIHSYYRKNKELPKFISDLKCSDTFNNRQRITCASMMDNGIFYVNHKKSWASAEPYILDKKIYNKCKTSRPFNAINDRYRDCTILDINSIPRQKTPDFNCDNASNDVERIICTSDRLIDLENKLSLIYKNILLNSPDDKKQKVKVDKTNFILLRSNKCDTTPCIKSMTTNKITRLEMLGVRNPKQ